MDCCDFHISRDYSVFSSLRSLSKELWLVLVDDFWTVECKVIESVAERSGRLVVGQGSSVAIMDQGNRIMLSQLIDRSSAILLGWSDRKISIMRFSVSCPWRHEQTWTREMEI